MLPHLRNCAPGAGSKFCSFSSRVVLLQASPLRESNFQIQVKCIWMAEPGDPIGGGRQESNPLLWGTREVQLQRPRKDFGLTVDKQTRFHTFASCISELDNCGNYLLSSARLDRRARKCAVPADPAVGIGRPGTEATGQAQRESRRPDSYLVIAAHTPPIPLFCCQGILTSQPVVSYFIRLLVWNPLRGK